MPLINRPLLWPLGKILFKRRKRMLIWGDSNSLRPDRLHCWPGMLDRMTRGEYAIINDSVEGRTTGFDVKRLNSCHCIKSCLKRYGPFDQAFVLLGTNDVKKRYGPPKPHIIKANLQELADIVIANNTRVSLVFLLPPPIGDNKEDDFLGASKRIERVCTEIHDLCGKRSLPIIDTHSIIAIDEDLESDAVHLNARGRLRVAEAVYKFLSNSTCTGDHI